MYVGGGGLIVVVAVGRGSECRAQDKGRVDVCVCERESANSRKMSIGDGDEWVRYESEGEGDGGEWVRVLE